MYSEAKGLHSDYGIKISDAIMLPDGALLGFTRADGKIPGGPNNAVTVSIRLNAIRPQTSSNKGTSPYANVGRNDPCPCGSGKKYKNCHGVLETR